MARYKISLNDAGVLTLQDAEGQQTIEGFVNEKLGPLDEETTSGIRYNTAKTGAIFTTAEQYGILYRFFRDSTSSDISEEDKRLVMEQIDKMLQAITAQNVKTSAQSAGSSTYSRAGALPVSSAYQRLNEGDDKYSARFDNQGNKRILTLTFLKQGKESEKEIEAKLRTLLRDMLGNTTDGVILSFTAELNIDISNPATRERVQQYVSEHEASFQNPKAITQQIAANQSPQKQTPPKIQGAVDGDNVLTLSYDKGNKKISDFMTSLTFGSSNFSEKNMRIVGNTLVINLEKGNIKEIAAYIKTNKNEFMGADQLIADVQNATPIKTEKARGGTFFSFLSGGPKKSGGSSSSSSKQGNRNDGTDNRL